MRFQLVLFAILSFYTSLCLAIDTITINKKDGLFTAFDHTVPVITSSYVGWEQKWKWAGTQIHVQSDANGSKFRGSAKTLDLVILGHRDSTKNTSSWHYQFSVLKSHPDAIGYGINFKLNLNSPGFKGLAKKPELLPNHSGWRWQTGPKQSIEVQFSPKLADVHFERGQKNQIRAMFFNAITKGRYKFKMKVTVHNQNAVKFIAANSPMKNDKKGWHTHLIPWNSLPIDLSFLNSAKPAGQHGFLKAKGDALVFEDGTPARFWGTNIQAYALFKTNDFNIKQQAKRLARLGFNLVRLHHFDSSWVHPNIFSNPKHDTLSLNKASFKKLDWWIKCLKDEGIYIWLDLQDGRGYTHNDGITNFDEIAKGKPSNMLRGFNYYNQSIQQRMKDFDNAYLSHINQFTGLAYKDDPAIVSVLIINENDLTQHFGNALLPNQKVPSQNKIYQADVKQAARRLKLNPKQAWRSWEYGDSKIYLNDAEHRFNQKMLSYLKHIGVKSTLITDNSWGGMSLASLPSLTDGDVIDVHNYGRQGELKFNPRYRADMLSWIGAAQVSNKPLSVTEWNVEKFPVTDRFTIPTWLASVASLQGWDSLMLYGYSQAPLNRLGRGSNYSTYNDPALMAMMPASALLFRQGHVAEAKNTYHIRLDKNSFFGQAVNPKTSATLRTLVEKSKISIDLPYSKTLPWLKPYESALTASYSTDMATQHIVTDPNIDFIPLGQHIIHSDTAELSHDWVLGIQTINTAKSQIISGHIGQRLISLKDVQFKIKTPMATVAVQSLDNKPIAQSNKLLISLAARSTPSNKKESAFLSEPVIGHLFIKARPGLTLYKARLNNLKPLKTIYSTAQGYQITLTAGLATPWLILMKTSNE